MPLPPLAHALLRRLERTANAIGSPFVMAGLRSRAGHLSEQALNHAMRRLYATAPTLRAFQCPTAHDLRRSLRTHLGKTLNVQWHIAERCLNHSLGRISAIYDVGDYVAERRTALERWETYLLRLVESE